MADESLELLIKTTADTSGADKAKRRWKKKEKRMLQQRRTGRVRPGLILRRSRRHGSNNTRAISP
jgi:hypothetical protein